MKYLDNETLRLVTIEVLSQFTHDEFIALESFIDFFEEMDVINGYCEEWDIVTYRPYCLAVYNDLRGIKC